VEAVPPQSPVTSPAVPSFEKARRGVPALLWAVVLVTALLALVAVGIGADALATRPAPTVGPRGARGPVGEAGPAGTPGSQGVPGPAGTLMASHVLDATTLVSAPNPAVGAVLVATTSCPKGEVLLSGGGRVSAPGDVGDRNVELRVSYPLNDSTWQVVAEVTGPLAAGTSMTLRPFVVCG